MLTINTKMCMACGDCVKACPRSAIRNEGNDYVILTDKCNACNACIDICAFDAIGYPRTRKPDEKGNGRGSLEELSLEDIPEVLRPFVVPLRNALIAAAAVGPLGVFGAVDTVAIGGIWTSLFLAIQKKSKKSVLDVPATIKAIVAGFAQYIIGCKAALMILHLVPFAGTIAGMTVSTVVNVYFTYRFALTSAELLNDDTAYTLSDKELVSRILKMLCRMPSANEVKAVWAIYKHWK